MKSVLILGAGVMQGPAISAAKKRGFRVVVVDGNPNAVHAGSADRFAAIDLKAKEEILEFARGIPDLAGVFTAGTDFSASVAFVAEALALPGISMETALDASDKARMRKKLGDAGVPIPLWVSGSSSDSPEALLEGLKAVSDADKARAAGSFPLAWVVKPVDNMGARGCRLARNMEELRRAWEDAIANSRSGRAIIEEYLEGPEFSIDALVQDGRIAIRGVADRHIFFEPFFIEMGHTMPSAMDDFLIQEVLDVFKKGVKALGIQNGAAKGDVKYTRNGAFIGEIAARLSGGYMSGWTYPYASGIDPAYEAIGIACGIGEKLPDGPCSLVSAERAFISIPGKIKRITGLEEAGKLPYIKDVFSRVSIGTEVVFPVNNVEKCGNLISLAQNHLDAEMAAERAARSILLELEPDNSMTADFISGKSHGDWPPPAYPDLPVMLIAQLERMPDILKLEKPARSIGWAELKGVSEVDCRDWMGRSIFDSLEAVRFLSSAVHPADADIILGRQFWKALFRGGYQAAVWVIENTIREYF